METGHTNCHPKCQPQVEKKREQKKNKAQRQEPIGLQQIKPIINVAAVVTPYGQFQAGRNAACEFIRHLPRDACNVEKIILLPNIDVQGDSRGAILAKQAFSVIKGLPNAGHITQQDAAPVYRFNDRYVCKVLRELCLAVGAQHDDAAVGAHISRCQMYRLPLDSFRNISRGQTQQLKLCRIDRDRDFRLQQAPSLDARYFWLIKQVVS